jgi:hypothetical protein
MTLTVLPLAMCSSNDDNSEQETPFEPIEVTFTEDFFTDCNQIKDINGVKLSFTNVSVNEETGCNEVGD